jgi:hypothetical protein
MVSALESADPSLDSQCRCSKGWVGVEVWVVEVVVTGAELAVVFVAADSKLQLIDQVPT